MADHPKVSVIIPSYNHERFIYDAIKSVLNQTYTDFELIIVDDASTDNSVEAIRTFNDDRIRFFQNESNQGAVHTTNFGIKQSRGDYIALLNSDDSWVEKKLSIQIEFLENHKNVGAVFSDVRFINENSKELDKLSYFWADVFKQENRSSALWLKRFFFQFNCLCHPSILIRREVYQKTSLYDPALRQLPDFSMWVDILKFTDIHVLVDKLVIFKVLSNNENASADTSINRIRTRNEIFIIMRDFFDNMDKATFMEGFHDLLKIQGDLTEDELKCEQAFMYLKMDSEVSYIYKLIAIEKFHKLLNVDSTREVLKKRYNFTERDYFKMTGEYELIDSSQKTISNIVIENTRKHLESRTAYYNFMKNVYKKVFKRGK